MIENDKTKKGPPKRNPECYQTARDITIPAGTILRSVGDDKFASPIGFGKDIAGEFSITVDPVTHPAAFTATFRKVIA